ncbi:hypothetical protein [Hymenobacter psychrophilus]|uniref:Uncharacterized protein n=1 Tax=Hymenobacter psychrophilus TaxID=651662 RepID=A0A1H3B6T0_9BACT|nr:hypothetical protein [Hymenobacter psychrophilus]SDX37657.1 hypothetical protein SAMN04488069_101180 [Hymenobacter psychrophilus]
MAFLYRSLFLFEADTATIFEIKRLDIQSKNPGHLYFWLYFDNASRQLSQLDFVDMSTEDGEHQREFSQGQLRFNTTGGTFSPADGAAPLTLRTINPPTLPAELETALFAFFA